MILIKILVLTSIIETMYLITKLKIDYTKNHSLVKFN